MWVYNSASTIKQGSKPGATAASDADATVLKVKLSLNWTGPFKILGVGPAASAPDNRPLASKVLYLDLPSDMPGADAKPRVTVERCKPCLGQDDADRPRFMPAGLSRYVLNKYSDKNRLHTTSRTVTSAWRTNVCTSRKSPATKKFAAAAVSSPCSSNQVGKACFALHGNGKSISPTTPDATRRHILHWYWDGKTDQHRQTNRL